MPEIETTAGERASDDVLRAGLEAILRRYARATPGEPFGREHDLRELFEALRRALASSDAVSACPTIKVEWSAGMGGLARIPSVVFLDVRETRTPRRGLHCAFLFREDMRAVYLALVQGTADLVATHKRAEARRRLDAEAARLRTELADLAGHGFRLDGEIDLGATTETGRDYERATVAYKRYDAGAIPADAAIEDDLGALLLAYTARVAAVTDRRRVEPVTWIFQCNPKVYDCARAVAELDELTWPVRQYADFIHTGDTVYLWESGPEAGIVAVATVLGDPEPAALDDRERTFARDEERLSAVQPRVRVRVERALERRIRRDDLREHPVLDTLAILKAPQGTNFPVTPEQARELEALAGGAAAPAPRPHRALRPVPAPRTSEARFDAAEAVGELVDRIAGLGFVFEPWHVAAYVAALRTKPFVILAGVSGTGKSRLPALVAEATGGESRLVPVRPDWTDSSDVIGYTDLGGSFRPGPLLSLARDAAERPATHFVAVMDEMNLARVEHYFAEVLSRIEDRRPAPGGGFASGPLLSTRPAGVDAPWGDVGLAPNLAVVGTVNMDESAHGFSRKVLDRAFTIELAEIDLALVEPARRAAVEPAVWPVSAWQPRALRLGELGPLDDEERAEVARAVEALTELNAVLSAAQLHAGYRTRDEMALFLLHARQSPASFVTRAGEAVDPLDLALQMKLLPRIAGGSGAIRRVLLGALGWAVSGRPFSREDDADAALEAWAAASRPAALPGSRFPRTAARLCLMWERLLDEGFTSFWS
jgi:5-methylcytosine-specific restriction protein B